MAVTAHLKAAVAVKVAATEITAVVQAVISISFSGIGILIFIIGILTCLIPVGSGSSEAFDLTPLGTCKSLGGTTKGI